jgi:hypothetical protein
MKRDIKEFIVICFYILLKPIMLLAKFTKQKWLMFKIYGFLEGIICWAEKG